MAEGNGFGASLADFIRGNAEPSTWMTWLPELPGLPDISPMGFQGSRRGHRHQRRNHQGRMLQIAKNRASATILGANLGASEKSMNLNLLICNKLQF